MEDRQRLTAREVLSFVRRTGKKRDMSESNLLFSRKAFRIATCSYTSILPASPANPAILYLFVAFFQAPETEELMAKLSRQASKTGNDPKKTQPLSSESELARLMRQRGHKDTDGMS